MKIVARNVQRFYVNGKGYASLAVACRSIAKERLRDIVSPHRPSMNFLPTDDERVRNLERWRAAYAAMFPIKPGCADHWRKTRYGFCGTCRDEWIKNETARIETAWKENPAIDTDQLLHRECTA